MATQIPEKLKTADLTRFIIRAAQLEAVKPVIAYWCEYWIVNQILSKGLHNGDAETLNYTTTLMDKLEQIKAENASNDAIVDDAAGQAYVEQFASETFLRADRTMKANKVTKQTAQTFQAAATFYELVHIWGSPEAEIQAKIKFAKWNAVRIIKALNEGKDPNETNPKVEPDHQEDLPALDPDDPEVQQLGGTKPQPASVEDVPDEQDRVEERLAGQSTIGQSLHPSAQASPGKAPFDPYPRDGFPYTTVKDEVSPMDSTPNERNGSVGGGYFPEVPTFTSETQKSTLQTAPSDTDMDLGLPQEPSAPPGVPSTTDLNSIPPPLLPQEPSAPPQDFYRQASPPPPLPPPQASYPPPAPYHAPPPQQPTYQAPPPIARAAVEQYNTDDVAIAKAQKHARWAISALNFEDAATAVKELREALKTLGAG